MSREANLSGPGTDASLRDRLLAFVETLNLDCDEQVGDDTPLVGSGLLDSLALLQLAMWIEGEIGQPLDPDELDLYEEWNTVGKVLECIQRHRQT